MVGLVKIKSHQNVWKILNLIEFPLCGDEAGPEADSNGKTVLRTSEICLFIFVDTHSFFH